MRVAVVGASGRIGGLTVDRLVQTGHEPVRISRADGVDVRTGAGLADALVGVDAVVDTTNGPGQDRREIVDGFTTAARHVLAAEQQAGVGHHVLLSIVGIDRGQRTPHYEGKRAQEAVVEQGSVPYTIVRATQFHDFAVMTAEWAEEDGAAPVAPLLLQPIAPVDVAEVLVDVVAAPPRIGRIEVAGPHTEDLVDMARRT